MKYEEIYENLGNRWKKNLIFSLALSLIILGGCGNTTESEIINENAQVQEAQTEDEKVIEIETETEAVEVEVAPIPYMEEHNVIFSNDTSFEVDSDYQYVNYDRIEVKKFDSLWFEENKKFLCTIKKVTVSEPDENGYVDIVVEINSNSTIKEYYDSTLAYPNDVKEYNSVVNVAGFSLADYYTGLVFPSRRTHDDDCYDITKVIDWDGNSYEVSYDVKVDSSWNFGDWVNCDEDFGTTGLNRYMKIDNYINFDHEITIHCPADYDGLVIYFSPVLNEIIDENYIIKVSQGDFDLDENKEEYIFEEFKPEEVTNIFRISDLLEMNWSE